MNVNQIREFAKTETGLDIPLSQALVYINERASELKDIIREADKDFFITNYTHNLVAGQSEYPFVTATETTKGFKEIKEIYINWGDGQGFIPVSDRIKPSTDQNTLDALNTYDGFFIVENDVIKIYPTPKVSVSNGIRLKVEDVVTDISAGDTELMIWNGQSSLREYTRVLARGVVVDFFNSVKQYDSKDRAEQDYIKGVRRMVKNIGSRTKGIGYSGLPDLSYLE